MDRETRKRLREASEQRKRESGELPAAPREDAPLENTLQPPTDGDVEDLERFAAPRALQSKRPSSSESGRHPKKKRPVPRARGGIPPWAIVLGAAVVLGGVGLVIVQGGGASAGLGGGSGEAELHQSQANYIDGRSKEIVAAQLQGLPSSAVSDEDLNMFKTIARERAAAEWSSLEVLLGQAELLGRQAGDVGLYRAAADRCWPMARDVSVVEPLTPALAKHWIEQAAEQERLQRRIGR